MLLFSVGLGSGLSATLVLGNPPGVWTLAGLLVLLLFGSAAAYACRAIVWCRYEFAVDTQGLWRLQHHRSAINRIILSFLLFVCMGAAILSLTDGAQNAVAGFALFPVFSALLLPALLRDPLGLEIGSDEIIVRYVGRRRAISMSDIMAVSGDTERAGRKGKPLKFYRVREGALVLRGALQSALNAYQAARAPAYQSDATNKAEPPRQ